MLVRFLRRESTEAPADSVDTNDDAAAADTAGSGAPRTAAKGRPTPKRRDAESKRRGPAPPPPRTQREAARMAKETRGTREERRAAAADRRAKMMAGDDRALMPRDRGPVRAYVRDIIDSRRHLMGLFMPLAVLVFVSVFVPIPAIAQYVSLFCLVVLASMIVEGVLTGSAVAKRARAKFPKEEVKGLSIGWYAFTRASQLRRLRVPKPRVPYGADV